MASSKFSMGLIREIIRGRWFMAYASFLIMSMAGATYIFAIYSKDIKSTLGYDQKTLNTLSFFKDFGANVGLHAGLLAEFTPPWVIITISSVMNFFGYFMIWLAIMGKVPKPHVWQMCFYIWVGANSQAFANTGALVTCVKNFPESRGVVLGLLKGFVGLSGAIFTQFYLAFYGTDSKSVVLLIAWLPAVVCLVFVMTIRLIKPEHYSKELNIFYKITGVSLVLAVCLLISIICEKQFSLGRIVSGISAAVVLILLFFPLYFIIREEILIIKKKSQLPQISPISPPVSDENPKVDGTVIEANPKQSHFANILHPPKCGEDFTILQAICSIDMILLFVATIFALGGTLTANDNMGQIGESLGYSQKSIATFVALTSIWNYAGRIAAGFASEYLIKHYRIPRPLIFAFVILLSCIGHLTIAFGIPGCLYYASIMTGFCLGAAMPLLLSITSEVFGLKYYSTLYNICNCASPIGSYILNVRVAGKLYDDEAIRQKGVSAAVTQGKELICLGVQCYKRSFLIITAATVGSALVMLLLAWRTREFYRSDIYAKFREASEGKQNEVPKLIPPPEGK
ncbi:Major facilitator superfamily [Rhynchospora pubera]|uniref:Major facilitator superfamily n=1 Tax=Rhynchospora pubera TaxID=906938 RepID=A0AAV8H0B4_9POAL|nr:Major facilitator superfamily [Rhynchospora pubera]KAJ4789732.1 Major facilitator superfamily [Rhynchospora pubera]KAJ4809266.1 Major facilitator superfamily [Rhynchospora pubera]